ncbi:MAG: hypothetical protein FJW39_35320 [Acidobacteria bacterium]|nr:hypothetical protein [Acidobacteriota bacterium]
MIAVLRQQGIPFHNQYRKSHGYWNPLRRGRNGSSVNRILSLVGDHPWTHRDLKLWAEWLAPKGTLRPGAMTRIGEADDSLPVTAERLHELFECSAAESLLAASSDSRQLLKWWSRRIAPALHGRVRFPLAVALARGPSALEEPPRVTVGTIHSVKGGEADVVFLFPDLSPAGDAAYLRHGPQRDSVLRLFYVGMTRARHTLYVCQRESSMAAVI